MELWLVGNLEIGTSMPGSYLQGECTKFYEVMDRRRVGDLRT